MELRLKVLGGFAVEGIESHRLGTRKARTLLKVLALARGRPVPADRLLDAVWPDGLPRRPEEQLAVLVSRLRAVLGSDRLVRTDAGYALRLDWLDLDAAADLAGEAARRLAAGSPSTARSAAEAALELAAGPVLPEDPNATWAEAERAAAEIMVAAARRTAAAAALATGDAAAVAHATAALEDDPYDETALRLLMEAHAAASRPAAALRAYAATRERIRDDLGADPAPETEALFLAILRREPLPAGSVTASPRTGGEARRAPAVPEACSPSSPGAGRPHTAAALPGRQAELAALDAWLERAAAGMLVLGAVRGEAGIGKTTLLDTWAIRAAGAGALVLRAAGAELSRNLPLQPLLDALDAHLRALPARQAVEATLGPDQALLAPLLTAAPESPRQPADPAAGQALVFAALLAVFARLAVHSPVAVLLDDMHLADRATLEWLAFAARRRPDARLLCVCAARQEEDLALPPGPSLVLGPLDLPATEQVVGKARAAALHARSGGHPLFLLELAAAGGDSAEGGQAGEAGVGALPASLRHAVAERCDRAGRAAATLRAAALLGPPIDADLLAGVLRTGPLDVLADLEEGCRRALLDARGEGFAFRHDLLREALAADAGPLRRSLLHREAARLLAARPAAEPLRVAHHARLGGDADLAAAALVEAAHAAALRYDYAESERLLDAALALRDTERARLRRARTRIVRGAYPAAEADALAALERGGGAAALEAAGWAAYFRRDFFTARRYAAAGIQLADGPARLPCLILAGRAAHAEGDLPEAAQRLEAALAGAAEAPQRLAAAAWLGQVRMHQGRPEEALDLAAPALLAGHDPDLQSVTLHAHLTITYALGARGRAEAALAALDAWEAEIERQGATRYRGRPGNFRAWLLRHLGRPADASDASHRALDEARAAGTAEAEVHALLDLAFGHLDVDDLGGAQTRLEQAESLQDGVHALRWRHVWRARLLRARLALRTGRAGEAAVLARELRADAHTTGDRHYADLALLVLTGAAAALGEPIHAQEAAAVADRLAQHAGLEAWRLTAELAAATGLDALWPVAESQAARVAAHAGPHADAFRRYAGARLERIRMAGRQGAAQSPGASHASR